MQLPQQHGVNTPQSPIVRYLRAQDLGQRYRTSITTIWRWAKQGLLPRGLKISAQTTVWLQADLDEIDVLREQGASIEQVKTAVREINVRRGAA